MIRSFRHIVFVLASFGPMAAAAADKGTQFDIKPILIAGDDNVQATAINNRGVIAATVYAGITDVASGVTIDGNTVTTLPSPGATFSSIYPRAISDQGDVFGWARGSIEGDAFTVLLRRGKYDVNYQNPAIAPGQNSAYIVPQTMGLTNRGEIFFNTIFSLSGPIGTNYGTPPHYRQVPPMNRFTVIESINSSGTVAGTSFSFNGIRTMFVGKNKTFDPILPPGAINTLGGFLNKLGAVAGSYVDGNNAYHGFVYQSGTYTSFDMPEPATSITTTGINERGRVVGSYVAGSSGKAHAFLYNGSTVSVFGTFESSDNIGVVLNAAGVMILARQVSSPYPTYQSFRVTCHGAGC